MVQTPALSAAQATPEQIVIRPSVPVTQIVELGKPNTMHEEAHKV